MPNTTGCHEGHLSVHSKDRLLSVEPGVLVLLLVALHVVAWTLAPALSHTGLPLDTVEAYAVGREWVIGYHKHPSLPGWLLEASRLATGVAGWPAYLVSALAIAATYGCVYLIGRDLLGAPAAVAATLLTTGIVYVSWMTPELNHNVVQMPIWTGIILSLVRSRERAGAGWWMLLGALGGIGLYAKLSTGVLLATVAVYILADRRCRAQIAGPGPWLGLVSFLVVALPLAHWLVLTDFELLRYAEARATGERAGSIGMFILKQVASSGGLYALAVLAFGTGLFRAMAPSRLADAWHSRSEALAFVTWLHFAPIALAVLVAIIGRGGMKGAWGTPMLSLTGLLVVAWAPSLVGKAALHRLVVGAVAVLTVVPIGYAVVSLTPSPPGRHPSRTNWPQAEMAARLGRIWHERTGRPLAIVGGDYWTGGIVSVVGRDRPRLLVEGDLARTPWLQADDIVRHGALFVWWLAPEHPPMRMRALSGLRIDGAELFRIPAKDGRFHEIWLQYVVRPAGIPVVAGQLPEWPQATAPPKQ